LDGEELSVLNWQNPYNTGKVLQIVQDKKLSYTWNVDEYPDMPETIVTWIIEALVGGSRSESMLVHSDLTYDFGDAGRIWSYFIMKLAEHCKKKQSSDPR
jgi:uncharacterized protein YndB with AHSA1/START domain